MRQVAAAERARSAKRSPLWLWVPSESFRWMTGPRSARSAGLLVGSIAVDGGEGPERGPDLEQVVGELAVPAGSPALWAGCLRAAAGARFGSGRSRLGAGRGRGARVGRRARRRTRWLVSGKSVLAEGLLLAQAVGVAAEVTLDVRPAHLALVWGRDGCSRSSGRRPRSPDTRCRSSALNCSRLQCSAIWKNAAPRVVAVHNARPSPLVRQPVSSTCTEPWSSTQSCNCRCGPASASEARWQIASTAACREP